MLPIVGQTNTRVNPVETSDKDEFGQWVHVHNFRAVKSAANAQTTGNNTNSDTNNRQVPFAVLMKQADQDNRPQQKVELRPRNNNALFGLIDITA